MGMEYVQVLLSLTVPVFTFQGNTVMTLRPFSLTTFFETDKTDAMVISKLANNCD